MRPVVASPCLNLQCFAYTRKRLPKLGIVSIPSLPPLPDSQTPYSFPQPSSICLSPTESDACLMHSFLDACKESPDAHHSIPLNSLPLNGCPGTPLTTNLLPNGVIQQPTLTPNLSTPSLLANTTATSDRHLSSTRQPSQYVQSRPTAADFFNLPTNPSTSHRDQEPWNQPIIENLCDPDSSSSSC